MSIFDRWRRRATSGSSRAIAEQAFERGKTSYSQGDYPQAAAEFRRAVKLAADSVDSQCLLGASLVQLRDNDGAMVPLRRCLDLAPDHDVAHYLLGMALSRADRSDEGEVHLAKAAHLGNEPARELMAQIGIDYCRECSRPVHPSAPDTADVVVVTPQFGVKCPHCGMVVCWTCYAGGEQVLVQDRPCPACGAVSMPPFEE